MDHDHSYRLLFSHPRMLRDLLKGFVRGDWLGELDFGSLERVESAHATDDLRERRNDIVWRVRWHERWIYLLVEFQSAIEPFMTVRVLTYVGLLYQDLIRAKEVTVERGLPAVLPIVVYNGHSRWRAAEQLSSLLYEVPQELDRFQVMSRFLLVDEGAYDARELASQGNLVATLFRLERARTPAEVEELVCGLAVQLDEAEFETLRRAFAVWLDRVMPVRFPFYKVFSTVRLWEKPGMLAETVQRWAWESRHEGLTQLLSRQLRKRFGDIPAPVQSRLSAADLDQLELWGEQLLDANSLSELFPEEHSHNPSPST